MNTQSSVFQRIRDNGQVLLNAIQKINIHY